MQKKIWKEKIGSKKSIMYWTNEAVNLPVEEDDIIHWWGQHSNINVLKDMKNKIVISSENLTYLNLGFGKPGTKVIAWRDIYDKLTLKFDNFKGEILGPIGTLWSEVNNDQTTF